MNRSSANILAIISRSDEPTKNNKTNWIPVARKLKLTLFVGLAARQAEVGRHQRTRELARQARVLAAALLGRGWSLCRPGGAGGRPVAGAAGALLGRRDA